MRVGFVDRTDLPVGLQIDDVENRSQRDFSSEPPGQSRTIRRPTDAELQAPLNVSAFLSARATDVAATVDTTANDTLRIRTAAPAAFTVIAVTSGAATAKTVILSDLNSAFIANDLPFVASIVGTNQIQIDTTYAGANAALEVDSVANGSTLSTAIGYAAGGVALVPLTLAALRTAVYPTATTIDVSSATVVALSTFGDLTAAKQAAVVDGVADVVAPHFVETGIVLLSFAGGVLDKGSDATFQPGGTRVGLAAGPALACLDDDGSTPFTL